MKVHRQTLNQRVSDDDVRAILRRQMRTARPTNAATIRGLGIACGSCRLSRLRREVERELASTGPVTPQVAPGSASSPQAAPSLVTVPVNTGTGGEAPAPAVPTAPVSQPADSVAAAPNRPALVGKPGRATAIPFAEYVRELLDRIHCAAAAFRAALGRRPCSRRKPPSPRSRSRPGADQPSQPWPQFLSSLGRIFGL
jgi:hypothetical protein